MKENSPRTPPALRRRLLPLHIGVTLQGSLLWVSVEKLFLNEIGFTAASVGVMAAAYAAVTPVLEVPSGILADRWSRKGVLILSAVALSLCTVIGGLSTGVPMYIVSAMILGVYFAMYSGTVESVVYDTVLETTGSGDQYETRLGAVRFLESAALVVSSLLGGWLAQLAGPRVTYFATIPFTVLAILAFARFDEPRLHRAGERTALRAHIALTYRTITGRGALLPIVLLGAVIALITQILFEFGPLWLVALAAPAVLFGPYWAALVSTLGIGGLIAGRLRIDHPAVVLLLVVAMVASSVVLSVTGSIAAVVVVQVLLLLVMAVVGIHVSALLHDAVPSTIRAGVASGVSTISWLGFLPFALAIGWVANSAGLPAAGWMITVVTALAGALLIHVSRRGTAGPPAGRPADPAVSPVKESSERLPG
ncbi:MFS transporter [Nakamurella sp. GG22]